MAEVHLYGKLRRFTDNQDPTRDSIILIPAEEGDTIEDIIRRSPSFIFLPRWGSSGGISRQHATAV